MARRFVYPLRAKLTQVRGQHDRAVFALLQAEQELQRATRLRQWWQDRAKRLDLALRLARRRALRNASAPTGSTDFATLDEDGLLARRRRAQQKLRDVDDLVKDRLTILSVRRRQEQQLNAEVQQLQKHQARLAAEHRQAILRAEDRENELAAIDGYNRRNRFA